MAIPFLPQVTPGFDYRNALVDLKPINEGIDALGKHFKKERQRNALADLDTGGLPPSLVSVAQAYDDPEKGFALLGQGVLKKADLDAEIARQKAMMPLQFDLKRRLLELEYGERDKLARRKVQLESEELTKRLAAIDRLGGGQPAAARPDPASQPWTPPAKPYGFVVEPTTIGMDPAKPRDLPRAPGMSFGMQPTISTPLAETRQTMIPASPAPAAPEPGAPDVLPPFSPDQIRDAKISMLFRQPKMAAAALTRDPVEGMKKRIDSEQSLRKEFTSTSKSYIDVRDAYSRVQGVAAQPPSPAGDMSLIFAYMKMLDPGSVVREGEFATAQNAAGVPDRIRNLFNRMLSGERLSEAQRADFLKQSQTIYKRQLQQYTRLAKQYREIAKRYKLDPRNIIPDYELPPEQAQQPKATAPSATPTKPSAKQMVQPYAGEVRQFSTGKFRYKGGDFYDTKSWERVE